MKAIIAASISIFALSGCIWDYNGVTNQWIDKATGKVVGCSVQEDDPIVPCAQLPGVR
jgi:hypothetical protein